MTVGVITRTGFPPDLDRAALVAAFEAHGAAVRAVAPPDRLLVREVRDCWGPLCCFLGVPRPASPSPPQRPPRVLAVLRPVAPLRDQGPEGAHAHVTTPEAILRIAAPLRDRFGDCPQIEEATCA